MIAYVSPSFTSSFTVEILSGAEEAAYRGTGYRQGILPFSTWNAGDIRDSVLDKILRDRLADAVVLITAWPPARIIEEYKSAGVPIIVVEFSVSGLHSIMVDNYEGGYMAGEYLVKKYGQGASIVSGIVKTEKGKDVHPAALDRLRGFKAAVSRQGFSFDESAVRTVTNYSREEGRQIMTDYIRSGKVPRAIFSAAGDETAIGLMEAAMKNGLKVPEDIAIAGYDDIQIAGLMSPALTTVRQPLKELGRISFETAFEFVEGRRSEPGQDIVEPELIIRESA